MTPGLQLLKSWATGLHFFRVQGLGFRVQGLGFRVQGLGVWIVTYDLNRHL